MFFFVIVNIVFFTKLKSDLKKCTLFFAFDVIIPPIYIYKFNKFFHVKKQLFFFFLLRASITFDFYILKLDFCRFKKYMDTKENIYPKIAPLVK